MRKITKEQAAALLKGIMAELEPGVIRDYKMPTLCNLETADVTGFAVILTLSTRYAYSSAVLDDWRKRLQADDYMVSVMRNQLQVRFRVRKVKRMKT